MFRIRCLFVVMFVVLAIIVVRCVFDEPTPFRKVSFKDLKSFSTTLPPENNDKVLIVPDMMFSQEMIERYLPGFFDSQDEVGGLLFRWHYVFKKHSWGTNEIARFSSDRLRTKDEVVTDMLTKAGRIRIDASGSSVFTLTLQNNGTLSISQGISKSQLLCYHDAISNNHVISCHIVLTLGVYLYDTNNNTISTYDSGCKILELGPFYLYDDGVVLQRYGKVFKWDVLPATIHRL